jgi:hypothetical protein
MYLYPDLEISLHRQDKGTYAVEFRFKQPDSDVEIRPESGIVSIDPEDLNLKVFDTEAYAKLLTERFFADSRIEKAFIQARTSAATLNKPLRVRLLIQASEVELHSLHWETLCDPQSGKPLCMDENLFFSRFPTSTDWQPVKLRPMSHMRALVVVANPTGLEQYGLAKIDLEAELVRARNGLGSISISILPDIHTMNRATLHHILDLLREGDHDILYLVAHGSIVNNESWLWLEDENGEVARISGGDLASDLGNLSRRPLLVVLASCESAGTQEGNALTALGPRLAEAGIPAVIAMQGMVTMETVGKFMPVFFTELQRHDGEIDRAVTLARMRVSNRPDYWMPVLFTRLRDGKIWLPPGFGADFKSWPPLIRYVNTGKCTPILGPGLYESLLGSQREIARQWAESANYPLQPYTRESLPQVAQYLTVEVFEREPYEKLEEYLMMAVRERFTDLTPETTQDGHETLESILERAWFADRKRSLINAYDIVSQLPLPIYITTNLNNLLAVALREAGKDPQVMLCPWNEYTNEWDKANSIYRREKDYTPTPERPLIYHLFGSLTEPDSIVLTEDDYFNFMIGVTRNRDSIPSDVRRALVDSALLFLGFQLDDWQFRVLFRSLLAQQGSERRRSYPHVAVQIAPDKSYILNPEAASRYLEKYFFESAKINLYWGSVKNFIYDLYVHCKNPVL